MFNTFFHGTVEELLVHVGTAPMSEVDAITDESKNLCPEELIQTVMDIQKVSRKQAEEIVLEIQMEEFKSVTDMLLEKGLIYIDGYDKEGNPIYKPTQNQ